MGKVANASIREAAERLGLSNRVLGARIERDEAFVRRALGKSPSYSSVYVNGKRYGPYGPYWRKRVTEETALRFAKAMHLDPVEIGL